MKETSGTLVSGSTIYIFSAPVVELMNVQKVLTRDIHVIGVIVSGQDFSKLIGTYTFKKQYYRVRFNPSDIILDI